MPGSIRLVKLAVSITPAAKPRAVSSARCRGLRHTITTSAPTRFMNAMKRPPSVACHNGLGPAIRTKKSTKASTLHARISQRTRGVSWPCSRRRHKLRTMRLRPDLWLLDPEVVHLNHGSFGAVPMPVLDAQRQAAMDIERSPERFYRAALAPAVDAVRGQVAAFLGTDPDGLTLLQNATEAVQVALGAVPLGPDSEIVITDHAYSWVKTAVRRACVTTGAVEKYVSVPASVGPQFEEELTASITAALTERTALVVLDQITSASALVMPVERVIAAVADFGAGQGTDVPVLIDGAHAPGLVDSPVPHGATFWLGNLHKWAF